jgi:hypothetical protein
VPDIGEKLGPVVDGLLEPAERLEGYCVGSQVGFMSGKVVVIAATDRRLIVLETSRKQEPKGVPVSIAAGEVASSSVGGGGGWSSNVESLVMDKVSLEIKVRTTSGEKLKLMVGKGGGPLGGLMGGETQENGVRAVCEWLARNDGSAA